jgi:hypothetical protein
MRNLEWFDGSPDKLEPGMFFQHKDYEGGFLIGHGDGFGWLTDFSRIVRWAWVIKPHELEWAADMAGKHAKGRPEQ